jgi:hypothetical protein
MIQRWQTLFLILALIANGLMFNFDLWMAEATGDKGQTLEALHFKLTHLHYHSASEGEGMSESQPWLIALHGLASLLTIGAIFLYKNRKLQLRVSRFAMLLETGLLVLLLLYIDGMAQSYFEHSVSISQYQTGIFLPIASVVCFFIANMFIMRDERLVRSAERLR